MNSEIRFIEHQEMRGSWNMAIDQALLQSVAETGIPVLRFYRWEPATLSLGYFQKHEQRHVHEPSGSCPLVRRSTGGGAILHERELTYSLCLPSQHPWASDHQNMVRRVHQSIIESLNEFGVAGCSFHGVNEPETTQAPFLCYLRRTCHDLILQGHKIVGSAQRKVRGAILQHGSILEQQSSFAPELPGICDLLSTHYDSQSFRQHWASRLVDQAGLALRKSELSRQETGQAMEIEIRRFSNDSWTQKR